MKKIYILVLLSVITLLLITSFCFAEETSESKIKEDIDRNELRIAKLRESHNESESEKIESKRKNIVDEYESELSDLKEELHTIKERLKAEEKCFKEAKKNKYKEEAAKIDAKVQKLFMEMLAAEQKITDAKKLHKKQLASLDTELRAIQADRLELRRLTEENDSLLKRLKDAYGITYRPGS